MRTLLDHVDEPGNFRPSRHRDLLATDRSLYRLEIADDDAMFERICSFVEMQELYKTALDDRARRRIALAFMHALDGNWRPYLELVAMNELAAGV